MGTWLRLARAAVVRAVFARRGVGYNNVDIKAAQALNKHVTIASGGNEAAVADHALAMFLSLAKKLNESHLALQQGRWSTFVSTELFEKTVGLIGFGRIARGVAKRVKGFDAKVLAYDPFADAQMVAQHGVTLTTLEDLLALDAAARATAQAQIKRLT